MKAEVMMMCNLSEVVYERGVEHGKELGVELGKELGKELGEDLLYEAIMLYKNGYDSVEALLSKGVKESTAQKAINLMK